MEIHVGGRGAAAAIALVVGLGGGAACVGATGSADCPSVAASASGSASTPPAALGPAPNGGADAASEDLSPPDVVTEMPRGEPPPSADEAATLWSEAVTLAREAKPRTLKCHRVVSATTRYAFMVAGVAPEAVRQDMAAYLRIARCAEQLGSYGFMGELGRAMTRAAPDAGHPELVARAWLGKRRPELALRSLALSKKKAPDDPNLALTIAKVHCTMAHWAECRAAAEAVTTLAERVPDAEERRRMVAGAHKYWARALTHEGALAEAEQHLASAEQLRGKWSDIEDIRDEITMARRFATIVDVDADDEVLLGIYHLVGRIEPEAPMLRVTLQSVADADARYRVEVDIAGVIQPTVETFTLKPRGARYVDFNPVLRPDFALDAIRGPVPTTLTVKVSKLDPAGAELVLERSVKSSLGPRDYLPMGTFEDELGRFFTRDSRYVAAWVTPNDKSVEAFLGEAKRKLKKGQAFDGTQSATVPQVKALFEALRARGVSYVMDPEVLTRDAKSQRTRLPAEVLASTNAQCLEGSILYATLLEAIGIQPSIVYVPGHAFLAWKPAKGDRTQDKAFYLETTMTGGQASFERAMESARARFDQEEKKKHVHVADIAALRKDGVTPQPAQQVPVRRATRPRRRLREAGSRFETRPARRPRRTQRRRTRPARDGPDRRQFGMGCPTHTATSSST
ncbi:MAG: hypothetical protein IT373_29205 [Polyangiaceae bacterium]|nr:hypothetical protein [Polyangiaceae bacterium]